MHGENGLIKVESADGTFTMTYDAEGLRRQKEEGATVTKFLWDAQKVLLETDGQNATVAAYTLSDDVYGDLVSQRRSGVSRFHQFDALGSTDRLTASDGTVTDSYVYYAFGQERASSGTTTNPYRYLGRLGYYRNGTNLLYLRARHYQPATARFLSAEAFGTLGSRYQYCRNAPGILADPSGLQAKPIYDVCKQFKDDQTKMMLCDFCMTICTTMMSGPLAKQCDKIPNPVLRKFCKKALEYGCARLCTHTAGWDPGLVDPGYQVYCYTRRADLCDCMDCCEEYDRLIAPFTNQRKRDTTLQTCWKWCKGGLG